jgi:hypothetical protein
MDGGSLNRLIRTHGAHRGIPPPPTAARRLAQPRWPMAGHARRPCRLRRSRRSELGPHHRGPVSARSARQRRARPRLPAPRLVPAPDPARPVDGALARGAPDAALRRRQLPRPGLGQRPLRGRAPRRPQPVLDRRQPPPGRFAARGRGAGRGRPAGHAQGARQDGLGAGAAQDLVSAQQRHLAHGVDREGAARPREPAALDRRRRLLADPARRRRRPRAGRRHCQRHAEAGRQAAGGRPLPADRAAPVAHLPAARPRHRRCARAVDVEPGKPAADRRRDRDPRARTAT